nr:tetratricopeptide repeat protein [Bacteroidota bacterium]
MKKYLLAILFFISCLAFADDNQILIREANKEYNEGLYGQAIELYEKAMENGYESFELYYNLGNAYFKLNNLASAILFFEKAKKLNPNDEDINFNLKIANSRIVDKIETVPELFYVRWWNSMIYALNVDEWAWVNILSFSLALVLILVFLLSQSIWLKKTSFWLGILILLFSISSYLLSSQKYNSFLKNHEAIVFTPTVTVKSSPSKTGIDLFVIHEGTKLQITDQVGDNWYEVKIANGSVGWIPATDIRKI